jgi:hypothetical protein
LLLYNSISKLSESTLCLSHHTRCSEQRVEKKAVVVVVAFISIIISSSIPCSLFLVSLYT